MNENKSNRNKFYHTYSIDRVLTIRTETIMKKIKNALFTSYFIPTVENFQAIFYYLLNMLVSR